MSSTLTGLVVVGAGVAVLWAMARIARRSTEGPSRRRQVEDLRDTSAGEVGAYEYVPRAGNAHERVARLMRAMPAWHPEYLTARLDPGAEAWLAEVADIYGLKQMARDVVAEGQV